MTNNAKKTTKIVIFAKAKADRDYIKGQVAQTNSSILFFENESICFDNLSFYQPDAVILKTDQKEVIWRFIFAIVTLDLNPCLIILSKRVMQIESLLPFNSGECNQFPVLVRNAGDLRQVVTQDLQTILNERTSYTYKGPLFVGDSDTIRNIRSVIPKLKHSDDPILISGESGTGKEYLARLLGASEDANGIFLKIDCHSLSQEASHAPIHFKARKLEHDSVAMTILIDGIDNACPQVQSELLLLMDDNRRPDSQKRPTPLLRKRFIATTQANLEDQAQKGTFRQDLFYRLNVIPIEMPPLRDRKEDIPLLADYFMLKAGQELNKSFMIPSAELKRKFYIHDWPGNVDELKRSVYRVADNGDESLVQFKGILPESAQNKMAYLMQICQYEAMQEAHELKNELNKLTNIPLKMICDKFISQIEKKIMQRALETTNWNRKKAAGLLNISYKSMLNKMKIYEIV